MLVDGRIGGAVDAGLQLEMETGVHEKDVDAAGEVDAANKHLAVGIAASEEQVARDEYSVEEESSHIEDGAEHLVAGLVDMTVD